MQQRHYMRGSMSVLGKMLIIVGCLCVFTGAVVLIASRINVPFLGKLPGDIVIRNNKFTFYFPLATSILISIVLSFILYAISRLHR